MNTLLLIAGILQTLATLGRNPALGFDASKQADVLEFLSRLVQRGDSAANDLRTLRTEVESILQRGTPPTIEEVASWKGRSDAAHKALQALKNTPKPL